MHLGVKEEVVDSEVKGANCYAQQENISTAIFLFFQLNV